MDENMKKFCPKCGHRMIHGSTAWICAECGFEEQLEEVKEKP